MRCRAGLKVWFSEWNLRPGPIMSQIDAGLEQSRVLLLCMSANAFGVEWRELEKQTLRFRNPLNPGGALSPWDLMMNQS